MKARKYFVGATALLTFFINVPQSSAEEAVIFDEEVEVATEPENSAPLDDEEDFGDELIFNDLNRKPAENPPTKETPAADKAEQSENKPVEKIPAEEIPSLKNLGDDEIQQPKDGDEFIDLTPDKSKEIVKKPRTRRTSTTEDFDEETAEKKPKVEKARFVKLTADDNFVYYLDRESAVWTRLPYSASEYMLDCWIRMIERNPDTSDLPEDLADYINDTENEELKIAAEEGVVYNPVDVEVLQHKKYYLEHYYLRPKTKQIQFLCELEVVGHPQNTISERAYDYKNWENLIPDSIESIIYKRVLKTVGTRGASESGHMKPVDWVEEYLRISMR